MSVFLCICLFALLSVLLYRGVVLSKHRLREPTNSPASFTTRCGRVTKCWPAGCKRRRRWQPCFETGQHAPFTCSLPSSSFWDWNVPAPLWIFKTSRALLEERLRCELKGEVSREFLVQSPSGHPGCQAPDCYLERRALRPYLRHWSFGASLSRSHT